MHARWSVYLEEYMILRLNCLHWSNSRVKFQRIEETAHERFCGTHTSLDSTTKHMNIIVSIYKNKASTWGNGLV